MRRVFLVEDDIELARVLTNYLEDAQYEVTTFHRGDLALKAILAETPDLAILDIMLPGLDGLEILKKIRRTSGLLVLFISAKQSEFDKILGLELGADDYLAKPFSAREMVARVKALFRRKERQRQPTRTAVLKAGGIAVDLDRKAIFSGSKDVPLTASEFSILVRMMRAPGRTFSRRELADCVLDGESVQSPRAIDVHIRNLRKKFEEVTPASPLRSVRGIGYRFLDE